MEIRLRWQFCGLCGVGKVDLPNSLFILSDLKEGIVEMSPLMDALSTA